MGPINTLGRGYFSLLRPRYKMCCSNFFDTYFVFCRLSRNVLPGRWKSKVSAGVHTAEKPRSAVETAAASDATASRLPQECTWEQLERDRPLPPPILTPSLCRLTCGHRHHATHVDNCVPVHSGTLWNLHVARTVILRTTRGEGLWSQLVLFVSLDVSGGGIWLIYPFFYSVEIIASHTINTLAYARLNSRADAEIQPVQCTVQLCFRTIDSKYKLKAYITN